MVKIILVFLCVFAIAAGKVIAPTHYRSHALHPTHYRSHAFHPTYHGTPVGRYGQAYPHVPHIVPHGHAYSHVPHVVPHGHAYSHVPHIVPHGQIIHHYPHVTLKSTVGAKVPHAIGTPISTVGAKVPHVIGTPFSTGTHGIAVAPAAYVPVVNYAPNQYSYHTQDDFGGYSFGYYGGPDSRTEIKDASGNVVGAYNYIDADGKLQSAQYTAGKGGFNIAATNIPVQVEDTYDVKKAKDEFKKVFAEEEARAGRSKRSASPAFQYYIETIGRPHVHAFPQVIHSPIPYSVEGHNVISHAGYHPYATPYSYQARSINPVVTPHLVPVTYSAKRIPFANTYVPFYHSAQYPAGTARLTTDHIPSPAGTAPLTTDNIPSPAVHLKYTAPTDTQ